MNKVREAAQDEPIPADVLLDLNEAETRALIDSQLRDAGMGSRHAKAPLRQGNTPDQARAIAIAEWPTSSGLVDYAFS